MFFCTEKKKRKEGEREKMVVVQWREDGEVAAWRSRRRAIHPSFTIRDSRARKTYRVRRYMTARVSWVTATRKIRDKSYDPGEWVEA
jgi:hypothetical protein